MCIVLLAKMKKQQNFPQHKAYCMHFPISFLLSLYESRTLLYQQFKTPTHAILYMKDYAFEFYKEAKKNYKP